MTTSFMTTSYMVHHIKNFKKVQVGDVIFAKDQLAAAEEFVAKYETKTHQRFFGRISITPFNNKHTKLYVIGYINQKRIIKEVKPPRQWKT